MYVSFNVRILHLPPAIHGSHVLHQQIHKLNSSSSSSSLPQSAATLSRALRDIGAPPPLRHFSSLSSSSFPRSGAVDAETSPLSDSNIAFIESKSVQGDDTVSALDDGRRAEDRKGRRTRRRSGESWSSLLRNSTFGRGGNVTLTEVAGLYTFLVAD